MGKFERAVNNNEIIAFLKVKVTSLIHLSITVILGFYIEIARFPEPSLQKLISFMFFKYHF